MIEARIPYGRGFLTAEVAAANCCGVFRSSLPEAVADGDAEVLRAMASPLGSPSLEELARGKRNAVIIASDHTRPVPSKQIIPHMLRALRSGSPGIDITILIATGFHRETTREELVAKFGEEIVSREKIVVHDAGNEDMLVAVGTLPSGGDLILNRLAMETELLVAEGFIEPHFFAGFSGGRKSVLPGVASRKTVLANHCSEFIQSPYARTGNLENNPIHLDMMYAAEQAHLAYIVNVVIDGEKRIVRAFAGDFRTAHAEGCQWLKDYAAVPVPMCDIVITSNGGYPLDQNVYQSVKGMTAGEAVCREGGVIILCASCADGHGGESFLRTFTEAPSAHAVWESLAEIPRNRTCPDQWQSQILARVMDKHHVIMVTDGCHHGMIRSMHMEAAETVADALEMAYGILGRSARVAIIPDGVSVIPLCQS